jgi:hypothetical protein
MGSGAVEAMLAALEHYVGSGGAAAEGTPAQAYVAGVRDGYKLAQHEGQLPPAVTSDSSVPLGFVVPPLGPPLNKLKGLRKDPESGSVSGPSLVDPDLRSTERAETLALFPPPARVAPTRTVKSRDPQRATSWPDDFTLSPERVENAKRVGADAAWEWDKFRDYHRARGSRFVDWNAAWRTWLRNAVDFDLRRVR